MVYAVAHIRGGQEMGRAWYDDGHLLNKKNTFTDFIDVTRGLVAQGYAAKDRVAAQGGSAGGLLMGAVANMAPQDYRRDHRPGAVRRRGHHHAGRVASRSPPTSSTSGAIPSRSRSTTTC